MHQSTKACPFVTRECLKEDCMAWRRGDCSLILQSGCISPFENKLIESGPLMYKFLVEFVKIMEDALSECPKCGPELWSYAQNVRASLLDELIAAELAEVGIRADTGEDCER